MKKKLIALSVAAVLSASSVMSASAATWADVLKNINTDRKIDVGADIEQRRNGTSDAYADGTINVEVSSADEEKSFDYKATLYMENVRKTFQEYYDAALLLCTGDDTLKTELDNMPVRGEFNIEVEFPSTMTVPTDMVNTQGEMKGFNEEAKKIFIDTKREIVGNVLKITVKVKNPTDDTKDYVTVKELYDDDKFTYLQDLTLTCEGVTVKGLGTHTITGKIAGKNVIGTDSLNPLGTVTYTAVQVQDGADSGKTSINESVVLATPTPAPIPGGGSGGSGSTGGSGIIAGGNTGVITPTASPEPGTTGDAIVPAAAETTATLDRDNHYAYIIGYPDGSVQPSGSITRAEVATIFFRLLTDDSRAQLWSKTNDYSDVNADDWYNNAISTMTAAKVVNGYSDGTFKPNATITRAEFAAIAARFINGRYVGTDKFSDISGHWAAELINRAAHTGWVNGYEDHTFKPDQNITRAEAMTLVNNVLNRHVEISGLSENMTVWNDNSESEWYYTAVQEATNSHAYTKTDGNEAWTGIQPARDWSELEKALSEADSAKEPEATATPEPTQTPEASAEPEATASPEVSPEPEASAEPEATAEPEASATPEPMDAPEK